VQSFEPLRQLPKNQYKAGDVLVVFGEVFSRGYVNGLIDEALKCGMKVIYGTVGRRDEQDQLRPLNSEELKEKDSPLINVPLECGFDLEKSSKGLSPCDQLKGLKLSEADQAKLDWDQVSESRKAGRASFRGRVTTYVEELLKHIPSGSNVLFAHTMAGGVPRAKIILPVMNRVFKGSGDRYASSQEFWKSELGRLSALSFSDVTANSFADLIELTASLRQSIEKSGNQVSYVAYGYHGTEAFFKNEYHWQSYAPYLQGFAKLELEQHATSAFKKGVHASVFNAPEILTNSSSIFLGVEVALYPLLGAFIKEDKDHPVTRELIKTCNGLLKPEHSLEEILTLTDSYFTSDIIKKWTDYPAWPQHNGPEQMELMLATSRRIIEMHKDQKQLLTASLSEIVFRACGKAMIREGFAPKKSVWWVGHDLVAKASLEA